MSNLLATDYTADWNQLIQLLHHPNADRIKVFLLRYVFQAAIYHIWRERNGRRHGDSPSPASRLTTLIDKNMRNRFITSIRSLGDQAYGDGMQRWFATRSP